MRILHWYPNFLGGGGVAGAVLGLALAQARAGGSVRIASADEGGAPLYGGALDGDELVLAWRPTWRRRIGPLVLRGLPRSLRAEIDQFAPDVIHAHGEFNPDNVWAIKLRPGCPVVLGPQGAFDPAVFRKSRARSKRLYARVARRMLYRHLASFHALSPRESEHIRRLAPEIPVYTVPQGGGKAASTPVGPAHGVDATARFVFVGRLDVYTKGLDLLLQALANVTRAGEAPVHVTLIGPDWLGGRAQLAALVAELGLANAVTLAGELSGDEVAGVLDRSDCAIQPSRHEGLSLSATEALVRGKPLIVSTETGHASYPEVANTPSVILVTPDAMEIADGIRRFVAHRDEFIRAARSAGPELADFFSWDRVACVHCDVYDSLLRGAR